MASKKKEPEESSRIAGVTLAELREMLKGIDKDLGAERVVCQIEAEDGTESFVYDILDVRWDDGMIIIDLDPAEL